MVRDREGCRERIGGRPVPTRVIAATRHVDLWKWLALGVRALCAIKSANEGKAAQY